MSKKCSTAQRFIRTEMTTYRIGTLDLTETNSCVVDVFIDGLHIDVDLTKIV